MVMIGANIAAQLSICHTRRCEFSRTIFGTMASIHSAKAVIPVIWRSRFMLSLFLLV